MQNEDGGGDAADSVPSEHFSFFILPSSFITPTSITAGSRGRVNLIALPNRLARTSLSIAGSPCTVGRDEILQVMRRARVLGSRSRSASCTRASRLTRASIISVRPMRENASRSSISTPISTLMSAMVFM